MRALLALALLPALAAPPRLRRPSIPASLANPEIPAAGAPGELVDLVRGRGFAIGPMTERRQDFQATVWDDGRVLLTGGTAAATSEWFDPKTRAFSSGPALVQPRAGHRGLLLGDGACLLLGGTASPTPAECLEPGAGAFRSLGPEPRFGITADALELEDGRVMLVDGSSGRTWLWDRNADARKPFREAGRLIQPRAFFRLTRLRDGRVLLTGGLPLDGGTAPTTRTGRRPQSAPASSSEPDPLPAELFTPRGASWTRLKARLEPRFGHVASVLPDGRVALFGGRGANPDLPVPSLEVLDPRHDRVEVAGRLADPGGAWGATTRDAYWLQEGKTGLTRLPDPRALLAASPEPVARLANAYQEPLLLPLPESRLLVLGAAAWGPDLERWDPRTGSGQLLGSLRRGTETLALLPDGKVLSVGDVVDLVDPRSGQLTPLGWRENLLAVLKQAAFPVPASLPVGLDRPGALAVPLDRHRTLLLGGSREAGASDTAAQWDARTRKLTLRGKLSAPRRFEGNGTGALRLKDGSVIFWAPRP